MIANAEFELQLTLLYSPAEDPATADIVEAAASTGVASHEAVVGTVSAANTEAREDIARSATAKKTWDLISEKRKEINIHEHTMLSAIFVKEKLVETDKLDTLFVHLYYKYMFHYAYQSSNRASESQGTLHRRTL